MGWSMANNLKTDLVRVHRGLLQHPQKALRARTPEPFRVRGSWNERRGCGLKANSPSRRGKPNPRLAQSPDGLKEAMHLVEIHYVVSEVWYAASEIKRCIKWELKKGFVMPIKANRYRVALSLEDKKWGDYDREATLKLDAGEISEIYVEQAKFPLVISVNGGTSRTRNRRRGCPVVLVQQRRNGR